MRGLALVIGVAGALVLTGLLAAMGVGSDNTGESVSASSWTDSVCGSIAAWEGQLESIGDEFRLSKTGARRHDGFTGEQRVQGTTYIRAVVGEVIKVTDQSLQEGLRRAGVPETSSGPEAALVVQQWAQQTENELRAVQRSLADAPNTTREAFAGLGAAVVVLERSAAGGLQALREAAQTDPELAEAFADSRRCRDLAERDA